MKRVLTGEILDSLAADDPRAVGARRDLRVLNAVMRHRSFFQRQILDARLNETCRTVTEIGAGDGSLLLGLAEAVAWKHPVRATIIDRLDLVSDSARTRFQKAGWNIEVVNSDLFEWSSCPESSGRFSDLVLANLFLHHFTGAQLKTVFATVASGTNAFLACEPRRSALAKIGSRLVSLLGCNSVTRHDAVVSVEAGFSNRELTSLWPPGDGWLLNEKRAGLFSHGFSAIRKLPRSLP